MNSIGYDFGDSASAGDRFAPGKLRALIEATLAKVNSPGYMGGPDEYFPTDADEMVRLTVDSIVLSYYRNGKFDDDWNYYLSYSLAAAPKKLKGISAASTRRPRASSARRVRPGATTGGRRWLGPAGV